MKEVEGRCSKEGDGRKWKEGEASKKETTRRTQVVCGYGDGGFEGRERNGGGW